MKMEQCISAEIPSNSVDKSKSLALSEKKQSEEKNNSESSETKSSLLLPNTNASRIMEKPVTATDSAIEHSTGDSLPSLTSTEISGPSHKHGELSGGRMFLGNLADAVTKDQLRALFSKYGTISDVHLLRGYGFVQFTDAACIPAAVAAEKGTELCGKKIDPQVAHKPAPGRSRGGVDIGRGRGRGRGPSFPRGGRGRPRGGRDEFGYGGRHRERDRSPGRYGGRGGRGDPGFLGMSDVQIDVPPPRDGIVIKVLLLGGGQRRFADRVADELEYTYVPFVVEMLDGRNLGQALRDAEENHSRYAVVVGSDTEAHNSVSLKYLFQKEGRTSRCVSTEATLEQLVNRIIDSERSLGFSKAGVRPLSHMYPRKSPTAYTSHNQGPPPYRDGRAPIDNYGWNDDPSEKYPRQDALCGPGRYDTRDSRNLRDVHDVRAPRMLDDSLQRPPLQVQAGDPDYYSSRNYRPERNDYEGYGNNGYHMYDRRPNPATYPDDGDQAYERSPLQSAPYAGGSGSMSYSHGPYSENANDPNYPESYNYPRSVSDVGIDGSQGTNSGSNWNAHGPESVGEKVGKKKLSENEMQDLKSLLSKVKKT